MDKINMSDYAEKLKKMLLDSSKDEEIGYVVSEVSEFQKEDSVPMQSRPLPRTLFMLGKEYGIGFPQDIYICPGNCEPLECRYSNEFISYEQCSEKQKHMIDERKSKIEALRKKVEKDTTGKYDKEIIVKVPTYDTNDRSFGYNRDPESTVNASVEIRVTLKELILAGYLPEDFDRILSKKELTELDVSSKLIGRDLRGGIVGGFKKALARQEKGK